MAVLAEEIRTQLAGIVGLAEATTDPVVCMRLAVDGKIPGCVVSPESPEQVAQILKYATEYGWAVIASGGATRLGIGNAPKKYDIALRTGNITRVRYYEPSDLTAGVGAGMTLQDLQALLEPDGLWLPLDPSGGSQSTIGGIVATNATGPLSHFYGAPRDMVVGMQVATPEGKLIRTGGRVVKNVAGYDLGKLLIGSHGTLGVITEVNLKLFPLLAERQTFVLSTGTLGIARDLRRSILSSPIEPLRMVLLDPETASAVHSGVQSVVAAREPQIWLEAGGSQSVIGRTLKELDVMGRAVGAKVHEFESSGAEGAWRRISDFSNWVSKDYRGAAVLKGTLPIAACEEFLSLAQQEALSEKARMASVALLGTGTLHLGLLDLKSVDQAAGLITRIRKSAEKVGGALFVISAAAGVKGQVDAWGEPGTAFELMRKLKTAWDPKGILAPGRFVGSI